MEVSRRVAARIEREYLGPRRVEVLDLLASMDVGPSDADIEGDERIHAAILKIADGDVDRLRDAVALAESDWRDVLAGAGLGDEDWRLRVAESLESGSVSSG